MSRVVDDARALFFEGVEHHRSARYAEAAACFEAALALVPGRTSVLVNLGAALIELSEPERALEALDAVLVVQPDHFDALCHSAMACAQLGRDDEALARFDRALALDAHSATLHMMRGLALDRSRRHIEAFSSYESALRLDPSLGPAWRHRGHLLRRAGRLAEAGLSYERAIEAGDEEVLNRYFLAATGVGANPAASPQSYVAELFDQYADGYEAEMVGELRYSGPASTVNAVLSLGRDTFGSALDLGCGTGLVAARLRPFAVRLSGVDISPRMIEAASRTGLYDELVRSDLLAYLQTTPLKHDLVICCDVFIYIGDLAPVFASVSRVLEPGGVFAFSVEAGGAASGYDLLPSLRYCHSEPYLRALAAAHGFEVRGIEHGPLRVERNEPVPGMFVILASRSITGAAAANSHR